MSNIKFVIGAVTGAIAGFAIASYYTSKKYNNLIDDEIESIKEAYKSYYTENLDESVIDEGEVIVPENVDTKKGDISDYLELANKYKREEEESVEDDSDYEEITKVERPKDPHIYEIEEEEYGELDEFETIECTLFSDGILADDDDGVIDDVGDVVGSFNLEVIDEENPIVYIRNEVRMIDFCIAYDTREYVKAMQDAHRIH